MVGTSRRGILTATSTPATERVQHVSAKILKKTNVELSKSENMLTYVDLDPQRPPHNDKSILI